MWWSVFPAAYLAGHLSAAKLVHVYSITLVLLTKEALGLSRLFSLKSISCILCGADRNICLYKYIKNTLHTSTASHLNVLRAWEGWGCHGLS